MLALPQHGFAQGASASGVHARARLIAGSSGAGDQARLAGVEIRLDPGFKTYWRHPGESGLPPAFDWSRSTNVAGIEVLWPAPTRFEDAGGVSYGYANRVVFPVRIVPGRAGEPVRLALKLEYGVCKDLCIPAEASLALDVTGTPGPESGLIDEAMAQVPEPKPLGGVGEPSILSVVPATGGSTLEVNVAATASKPQLFVEAPDGWYLAAREGGSPPLLGERASASFTVDVLERPKQAAGPVELRLTLVAGARAVETTVSLDSEKLSR